MRRTKIALVALAGLAGYIGLVTPFAFAHDTPPSPGTHFLRWAIVSHGSTSNSDTDVLEGLDRLKRKYGDELLYIWRDDQGGYVIRDRSMVERAYRALTAMRASGRDTDYVPRDRKSSRQIKAAGKRMKHEIRAIFEEAKTRHLAERVE